VGEFLGQFRSQYPEWPEQAMEVGILVGVTSLCDGASVSEAVAAAAAAALHCLEAVQVDTERGLVTTQSPLATPNVQVLSGENAQLWLIKHGYIRSDRVPLPPFNTFRSQMLSQGAGPGDQILGIGGDWSLTDPTTPLGYVTILVREPMSQDNSDETLPPDLRVDDPAEAGGVKLSPYEIQDIVSWGVKHNRDPADIRKDVREANESAGGTGEIPIDVAVARTPLGPVTATADEVAEYERVRRRIEELQRRKLETRQQITELEQRQRVWVELSTNVIGRWQAGTADLTAEHGRRQTRLEAIEKKYARPSVWDFPDTVAWRAAVERWELTPEAKGEISPERQQEIAEAHRDFIAAVQRKTTDKPDSAEGTSWYNRHIAKLEEISRLRQQHLDAYRQQHTELAGLTEQRSRFEQRALR
jgi:hypothetical protein